MSMRYRTISGGGGNRGFSILLEFAALIVVFAAGVCADQ